MPRRLFVTAALPYANGPIHIGHLVEAVQTDVWVRFQRLRGHEARFFWADDTHGTAVMISAKRAGVSEEEFVAKVSEEHQAAFRRFGIAFDHYGSTHSEANRTLCEEIWAKLNDAGLVVSKSVTQLFDPVEKTFLADRFVKGICPCCGLKNQNGDSCDNGYTYSPVEVIDPVSTLSGATPEVRDAEHLFVRIEPLREFLNGYVDSGAVQPEVANYLKGQFLNDELRDWDVSRPAPYFGFEIPGHEGNYWYVWFDAPVGYFASCVEWCARTGGQPDDWFRSGNAEIHHFIGRDIVYFHTLFWPAMLKTAGFSLPEKVHVHGFLTVGGEKMSKSKGTFIKASTFADHVEPQYLRYYFATKLTPRWDDFDLDFDEFVTKVNSDIVGKVVNLASRTAKFVAGEDLAENLGSGIALFKNAARSAAAIAANYEKRDYAAAVREILGLADEANSYIESNKPWEIAKEIRNQRNLCEADPAGSRFEILKALENRLLEVCTVGLNLFRQIVIYLSPILPELAEKTGALLNAPIGHWDDAQTPLVGTPVNKFEHMAQRVDPKKVAKMIEESKEDAVPADAPVTQDDSGEFLEAEPLAEECTIDDFVKVDLRVARVISCEEVPEARKLLKLTLGLGGTETRQVFAGIKSAYKPEELTGKLVVMVANLKPRQMKFGLSEGMVCAAGGGGKEVFVLSPDDGARPGMRAH
ncbi:MAG: methionine--tRNA ligase [Planctomycetota bacterium]